MVKRGVPLSWTTWSRTSVLPGYNLKISFPFILLLYDPIWQLHPLAGRISPSSVIRVFICLHQDSTVRHASMIFALNTILIYTFSDCSSCMHGFFKCIIIFPLPGQLPSHYLSICSFFYANTHTALSRKALLLDNWNILANSSSIILLITLKGLFKEQELVKIAFQKKQSPSSCPKLILMVSLIYFCQ